MMGTGPFAVPIFRMLHETGHTVVALVTSPLRTHRGRPVAPISSIRDIAKEHNEPIFDPENINTPESLVELAKYDADLFVVCDYGQILSPAALAAAHQGGINLHASLLPKYRGAAPINWAIFHGETETGVTVIGMTAGLDAGPCIGQTKVAISPDDTADVVEHRLAEIGARLVCETIDHMASGNSQAIPQDSTQACRAPRLKKTDGAIDWSRSAEAIRNQIRALEPWPKTFSYWHRADGAPVRLILGPASVVPCDVSHVAPGTILEASGNRLLIATGENALLPTRIQPSGKRELSIEEFLRGYHVRPGDRFGGETI